MNTYTGSRTRSSKEEITRADLERLKMELEEIMDEDEDSVIIYSLRSTKYSSKEVLGVEKGGQELII